MGLLSFLRVVYSTEESEAMGSWKRRIWLDTDVDTDTDNFKIHFYIYTTLIFHTLHCFYCGIHFQTLASILHPFISAGVKDRL